MQKANPILSICIPTYNRAAILRDTLEKYSSCAEFDDSVEIVISDNASPDETPAVCKEFTQKFSNIRYYRNVVNVRDENFVIVQNHAQGEYIKLMNDNIYMPNEGLRAMKQYIRANIDSKKPIFFVTGPVYERIRQKEYTCRSMDEYVRKVSLFVTAISLFGVWRTDWVEISDKTRFSKLQLSQVDWTYQLIEKYGMCQLIYMEPYWCPSKGAEHKFSESYNFFKVHLTNYDTIKQEYVEKGLISPNTMRKDGRMFLRHYRKKIGEVLFGRRIDGFDYSGTKQILKQHFSKDWYFYWFILSYPLWYAGDVMRRIKNKIKRICVR